MLTVTAYGKSYYATATASRAPLCECDNNHTCIPSVAANASAGSQGQITLYEYVRLAMLALTHARCTCTLCDTL
jgi:hypothetical protein